MMGELLRQAYEFRLIEADPVSNIQEVHEKYVAKIPPEYFYYLGQYYKVDFEKIDMKALRYQVYMAKTAKTIKVIAAVFLTLQIIGIILAALAMIL